MKIAVTNEQHGFDVVEVPDPVPRAGELVIRVAACGVCGSDIKAQPYMPPGMVMGHELGGEVVAVGAGVKDHHVGSNVAVLPVISCGSCAACAAGTVAHCAATRYLGMGPDRGGFAEFVAVGAIDPTPMIGPTLSLDRIGEAFDLVRAAGVHGRVLVNPGGNA